MKNIEEYIRNIEEYLKYNPGMTEDMLIRHVYLDLGKRLSFNINYLPFGNSKKREEIYKKGYFPTEADKCLGSNIVICNSASKILEIVLKHFKVNIKIRSINNKKNAHVYNIITTKDGKNYTVDLQEDMYYIKMHAYTPNYGKSVLDGNEYVLKRNEIELIDKKIGYISDIYYTDDYLYLLKSDIGYIDNFYERVKFVLENIEVLENSNINHIDRQWYHVRILENLFSKKEFDYQNSEGLIKIFDCYKDSPNILAINCITVEHDNKISIFLYNPKEYKYQEIEFEYFLNAIKNGLVIYRNKIKEVEKALRKRY